MKLPVEIREQIIERMINNVFTTRYIKSTSPVSCNCAKIERPTYAVYSPQMKALPSVLGPALNDEFFRIFFRKKVVKFCCCCELEHHLTNNPAFVQNVRDIKVHWSGVKSATAFKKLADCPMLEGIHLNISKSTLVHLDKRSEMMKQFFAQIHRNVRITDILGLDEVMTLRGLKHVAVSHLLTRSSNLATEVDRANLAALLMDKLTQAKEVSFLVPFPWTTHADPDRTTSIRLRHYSGHVISKWLSKVIHLPLTADHIKILARTIGFEDWLSHGRDTKGIPKEHGWLRFIARCLLRWSDKTTYNREIMECSNR